MLTNDFLKFNSDAFPKESLVKTPINNMFNTKISRKKGNDNFTITKGIRIEVTEVATIQEKIIFRRLFGLND